MSFPLIVDSVISPGSVTVPREGFGVPMVVFKHSQTSALVFAIANAAELVTTYGFSRSNIQHKPLFQKADQVFAQTPKPSALKIARRISSVTPIFTLAMPSAGLIPGQSVSVTIGGIEALFVGDATPSAAELATGLAAAINVIVPGVAVAAAGVVTITCAADTPLLVSNWSKGVLFDDATAAATVGSLTADLDAIIDEDGAFFGFDMVHNVPAEAIAAALWAESKERLYCPTWSDSDVLVGAATTDVGSQLKAANYSYTYSNFTKRTVCDGMGIALFSRLGAEFNPGAETFAHKGLVGIAADKFTTSEIAALEAKNVNFYAKYRGLETTWEGKVAGGPLGYVDVVRGLAWLNSELKATGFETLRGAPGKVAYTDEGAAIVGNRLQSVLDLASTPTYPVLRNTPRAIILYPKVADVPVNERAVRNFPGYTWSGEISGAFHTVKIRGVVSV
jgi:Protein of unknown function (DUF3383)